MVPSLSTKLRLFAEEPCNANLGWLYDLTRRQWTEYFKAFCAGEVRADFASWLPLIQCHKD
jgi:hypothetical protein